MWKRHLRHCQMCEKGFKQKKENCKTHANKPDAQATGAHPSQCNFTNRLNPPL